jgi:transcriptional regulator with XRE-family HTH domain
MPESNDTPPSATTLINNDTATARRKAIGSLIRSVRELSGRKPKDIADFIGISGPMLSAVEAGEKDISLPQLEAVAYFLRVPVHTLLGLSTLTTAERSPANLNEIMRLRGHIIGARLKQARSTRGESVQETASETGLTSAALQNFELGKKQPSVTELEALMAHFGLTLDDMLDVGIGPLGEAQLLQQQRAQFEAMPEDLRIFLCDAHSLPLLYLAMRLRNLTPEQLRAIATAFASLAENAGAARAHAEPDSIG